MQKYRKKPIIIEAVQLTSQNIKAVYEMVNNVDVRLNGWQELGRWTDFEDGVKRHGLTIPTLEDGTDKRAKHIASIGDWIIKGIHGEFYPCKPDIFEATYEAVK